MSSNYFYTTAAIPAGLSVADDVAMGTKEMTQTLREHGLVNTRLHSALSIDIHEPGSYRTNPVVLLIFESRVDATDED